MRIVFLKDGETIGVGGHSAGTERDVADDIAGVLIKRGVAAPSQTVAGVVSDLEGAGKIFGEESSEINESSGKGEREDGRE